MCSQCLISYALLRCLSPLRCSLFAVSYPLQPLKLPSPNERLLFVSSTFFLALHVQYSPQPLFDGLLYLELRLELTLPFAILQCYVRVA